jgi:uncharacterized damage-inducible protein DinB
METSQIEFKSQSSSVINPDQLLQHWQGHRELTRRVISLFPEEHLFSFSLGGMRPFSEMVKELLGIAVPGAKGLATELWEELDENLEVGSSKERLLEAWDKATEELNYWWKQIPLERFQSKIVAFGLYEDKGFCTVLYFIDNEVHHRGQAYVYLRALGITPPNFWER